MSTSNSLDFVEIHFDLILLAILFFTLIVAFVVYLLYYIIRCKNVEKALIQKSDELYTLYETLSASEEELKVQNEELINQRNLLESQKESLIKKQKTIEDYAFYDCLTHLPNRHTLKLDVQKMLIQSSQNVIKGALFFIDFDNFKHVNDHFGHTFGDEMLIHISERMMNSIAEYGKVYRFGGDEFIILADSVYEQDTIDFLANKLFISFRKPLYIRDHEFHMTFSMGIAIAPFHGNAYDELIGSADMAMYAAKNAGKNQFAYYDEDTKKKSDYIGQLQQELQKAVYNDELAIHYQPVYNIRTNKVQFIEAMLRWQSNLGNISPSTFLPISKELNLMASIQRFVFNEVCDLNNIVNISDDSTYISFNLSSKELLNAIVIQDIEVILNEKRTDPSTICLEISETMIENNFDDILSQVIALRTLGFRIIIDDFGKEYLSLNYLKKLPIDFLKIDISFFHEHGNNHSILKALIDIIHELNIEVIIKGIESDTHLSYLKYFDYKYVQGHYYGYPITRDRIISMILEEDIKIYHIHSK
ncbi:bifunctional diguanylate cyclase/phosphodiesterase [Fusibacter sp. 3D3]|uniref:putative bifunctional diguanylate cyclase/phosphodiesterase n=1 Tax=Fusibacter sp. 3D3 TaxID=1048380 RepID=UPI000852D34F|nr:EAL domain-containing protein [Fusibacter sp. 3D3]GAU77534.1 diguanylate cyclase/phosphodiesterase [Fusibacter sp. 3D3]